MNDVIPERTAQQILAERRSTQPPLAPPAPAAYRTSGMAVASLVLGVLWLGWVGSLLAVIFGHAARGEIRRSGGTIGGKGMATVGVVLGWLAFVAVPLLVMVAVASSRTVTP